MNLLLENAILLVFSALISAAGLGAVGVMLAEAGRLIRDFVSDRRGSVRHVPATALYTPRAPSDTGPLRREGFPAIEAYQDRETVERLIQFFKDEEDPLTNRES